MTSQSQPQQINIADLDLPQLSDVRKQLDEELSHFSTSFQRLKQAQAKFKSCLESVSEIKPQNKDKTILVPLTNSLYVPAKLADYENVIVDIGTGYYVQKSRADASKYYQSKIDLLRQNLESLQETISKKQDNLSMVVNIMQSKLQAQVQTAAKEKGTKS